MGGNTVLVGRYGCWWVAGGSIRVQVARYGVLVGGNKCWLVNMDAGGSIRVAVVVASAFVDLLALVW